MVAPVTYGIIMALPDCGLDEPWWELRHLRLALLPGLVDLLALAWLASRTAAVRRAAVVAGFMGVARFVLPQAGLLYAASSAGQVLDPACSVSVFFLAAVLAPMMLALWLGSALVIAVMLYRGSRRERVADDGQDRTDVGRAHWQKS